MKIQDAASILGLTGKITPTIVKQAFRKAAKAYHPDINPAGENMMKIINAAFDALKDFTGEIPDGDTEAHYPEALNEALKAIIDLDGLIIEVCGAWVWVTGNTYPYKDILKDNSYKYAAKKKAWHFRPENWKSRSRGKSTMEEIREKFGSEKPAMKGRSKLSKV